MFKLGFYCMLSGKKNTIISALYVFMRCFFTVLYRVGLLPTVLCDPSLSLSVLHVIVASEPAHWDERRGVQVSACEFNTPNVRQRSTPAPRKLHCAGDQTAARRIY